MPSVIDKPIYTSAIGVKTTSMPLNIRLTEWSKCLTIGRLLPFLLGGHGTMLYDDTNGYVKP